MNTLPVFVFALMWSNFSQIFFKFGTNLSFCNSCNKFVGLKSPLNIYPLLPPPHHLRGSFPLKVFVYEAPRSKNKIPLFLFSIVKIRNILPKCNFLVHLLFYKEICVSTRYSLSTEGFTLAFVLLKVSHLWSNFAQNLLRLYIDFDKIK